MSAKKYQGLLHCLILIAAVFISYGNVYENEFLWDDEFLIQKNKYIESFDNTSLIFQGSSTAGASGSDSFYRPIQGLFFTTIYQFSGREPWGYHLGHNALHALNAILVYLLILTLWQSSGLALGSALLWSVHPAHTEAITYMSGTADPLGLLFSLISILIYLKATKSKTKLKTILLTLSSLAFFVIALVSKESTVVLAPLVMLLVFITPEHRWSPRKYLRSLPHWVVAIGYMLLRRSLLDFENTYQFYAQSNIYTENILYRVFTFLATIPEYIKILFWPADLHMERQFPVYTEFLVTPVILGFIFCLTCIGLIFFLRKKNHSTATFAILWFFISFVPMMGILIPVNSFLLEHWLYFPSIGIFLLAAQGLHTLGPKLHSKYGFFASILATTCFLSYMTWERNKVWQNPITFYSDILNHHKGSARIHNNIAMAYAEKENLIQAETHYLKAIQTSDSYPQTHHNLARVYIKMQNYQQALKHLNKSLKLNPNFTHSQLLLKQLQGHLNKTK